MFCDQCGNPLPDSAVFCTHCGNPLPPIPQQPKKKSRKAPLIIGLCASLLLVVGLVVAVLFLFPGKETVYLLTSRVSYNESGEITGQLVFDYDSQGRLLCAQLQNAAGETHRQFRMEYDEYGSRILEASDVSQEGFDHSFTRETVYDFSYDEDGRVETCQVSSGGSDQEETCEFFYDKDGNLVLVESTNPMSFYPWQYYEYDRDGNLTAEYFYIYYFPYGFGITKRNYVYNKQGQLTETSIAYGNSEKALDWKDLKELDFETHQRWDYEYDRSGRLCAVEGKPVDYDKNGNLDAEGFVFDENGNLIREENANGSYIAYTYESLTLSRADARVAQRLKSCLPSEFMTTTYVPSLDPVKTYMYPIILQNNMFYSYMIPHPIW